MINILVINKYLISELENLLIMINNNYNIKFKNKKFGNNFIYFDDLHFECIIGSIYNNFKLKKLNLKILFKKFYDFASIEVVKNFQFSFDSNNFFEKNIRFLSVIIFITKFLEFIKNHYTILKIWNVNFVIKFNKIYKLFFDNIIAIFYEIKEIVDFRGMIINKKYIIQVLIKVIKIFKENFFKYVDIFIDIIQDYFHLLDLNTKTISMLDNTRKIVNSLESWHNPSFYQIKKMMSSIKEKQMNYDHQVIVELESDPVIYNSAQKLFFKHPHSSIWIQLDTKAKEYRILYGSLEKLTDNCRIYIVGHGSARLNAITKKGLLGPKEIINILFIEKLIDINNQKIFKTPLFCLCPKKIVLVSCQMASQEYNKVIKEQFASQMLFYLLKLFTITPKIVGYTNNISILPSGGKRFVTFGRKASYFLEEDGNISLALEQPKRYNRF